MELESEQELHSEVFSLSAATKVAQNRHRHL